MIIIYYNDQDVFDGISPTPIVSLSDANIYNNSHLGAKGSITLSGRIRNPNQCDTNNFTTLYNLQRLLIARLSKNFQKLEIKNEGVTLFSKENVIVESINFSESNYFNLVPYNIVISFYEKDFASLGILNPFETFEYSYTDDHSLEIVHNFGVEVVNNSNQALINAKNFILDRQGLGTSSFTSSGIYDIDVADALLQNRKESIDRLGGKVSMEEKYLIPIGADYPFNNSIGTYSVEVSQDIDAISVTIDGEFMGEMNATLATLMTDYVSIDFHAIAQSFYRQCINDNAKNLPNVQISRTINHESNKISFAIVFSDKSYAGPHIIDSTTITQNYESNEYCITFSASIVSDYGCLATRWEEIQSYYESINIENLARQKWAKYGNGARLSPVPRSRSYSENEFAPEISASITFCNAKGESCGCLEFLDYKFEFQPPIPKFISEPSLNGEGCYAIQNLGYKNRSSFSISGDARVSQCCSMAEGEADLSRRLNELNAQYYSASNKILESYQVTKDENARTLSFSVTWTGDSDMSLSTQLIQSS